MASQLLTSIRRDMRLRGYSIRTEKAYLYWIRFYIRYCGKRHPADLDATHVKRFLTFLAADRHVAVNTQKVALNALAFLYRRFLQIELGEMDFSLATKQRSLPAVLSPDEVAGIIAALQGRNRLIVQLLYGSGLRISECLRLRVQDIDFSRQSITVRDGKARKDRQTLVSPQLLAAIRQRYQNGTGAARPQRYQHHPDLHPCTRAALRRH